MLGIVQSWSQQWREKGIQLVITTRLVAAAAPSMISQLDSTPVRSDRREEEGFCP